MTRILWVEDDGLSIRPLVRHAADHDCRVDVVPDGAAALEHLRAAPYDLILLDYKLKHETGFDVLVTFHRLENCPPVVVLSAYATMELAVEAVRLGAVDVRAKPIRASELMPVVQRWKRTLLVTTDGIVAPPWTTRAVARLNDARVSLNALESRRELSSVLRELGLEFAAPDILIPEVMTGAAAFRSIASSPYLDTLVIDSARTTLMEGVFDRGRLDPAVFQIVERFEAGGAQIQRLRVQEAAREFGKQPIDLGRRVSDQTKLRWAGWRLGARLRSALRQLRYGCESIKSVGLTAGWAWSEDFSRDFKRTMGLTADCFRELLASPDFDRSTERPDRSQIVPVTSNFLISESRKPR